MAWHSYSMITREINFYLTPTFNKYPLFTQKNNHFVIILRKTPCNKMYGKMCFCFGFHFLFYSSKAIYFEYNAPLNKATSVYSVPT